MPEEKKIDLGNRDTVYNLICEAFDYIPGDEYLMDGDGDD